MRKTSDLVKEMLAEAKDAWLVAIAVGYEGETKFVFSRQKHALEALNQLVQNGGSPLGLLRFDKEKTKVQGSFRPFEEYAGEEWVVKYLAGLMENAGEIIDLSQDTHSFPKAY